jgi:hypothetical protein
MKGQFLHVLALFVIQTLGISVQSSLLLPDEAQPHVTGVGAVISEVVAGEIVIDEAAKSLDAAYSTATVRLIRFAACSAVGVLSPEAVTREQEAVPVAAALTVMVSMAFAVPALVSSAVPDTPALPQELPTSWSEMAVPFPVKLGSTRIILSFTAILLGAVNVKVIVVAVPPLVVENASPDEVSAPGAPHCPGSTLSNDAAPGLAQQLLLSGTHTQSILDAKNWSRPS